MRGTVYKIIALQGNEIYVGSTFGHLNDRWYNHKKDYRRWVEGKKENNTSSFTLFDKYGIDNCRIIPIKQYEVVDRKHLEMYETLWICKLKSINKNRPFGIKKLWNKQYREEHKEELSQQKKQYREKNRDIIAQKKKEKIYCSTCDCEVVKETIKRHERTQKHINNLNFQS